MTRALNSVDAGNSGQEVDRVAKGLDLLVDLPIDRVEGRVESIDVLHVQPQHKAVMIGHPTAQPWHHSQQLLLTTPPGRLI